MMKRLKQAVLLLFLLGWVCTPSFSAAQAPSRTKLRFAVAELLADLHRGEEGIFCQARV